MKIQYSLKGQEDSDVTEKMKQLLIITHTFFFFFKKKYDFILKYYNLYRVYNK
jgi:hypothetical protein